MQKNKQIRGRPESKYIKNYIQKKCLKKLTKDRDYYNAFKKKR